MARRSVKDIFTERTENKELKWLKNYFFELTKEQTPDKSLNEVEKSYNAKVSYFVKNEAFDEEDTRKTRIYRGQDFAKKYGTNDIEAKISAYAQIMNQISKEVNVSEDEYKGWDTLIEGKDREIAVMGIDVKGGPREGVKATLVAEGKGARRLLEDITGRAYKTKSLIEKEKVLVYKGNPTAFRQNKNIINGNYFETTEEKNKIIHIAGMFAPAIMVGKSILDDNLDELRVGPYSARITKENEIEIYKQIN